MKNFKEINDEEKNGAVKRYEKKLEIFEFFFFIY
jgi:hypothetical protein